MWASAPTKVCYAGGSCGRPYISGVPFPAGYLTALVCRGGCPHPPGAGRWPGEMGRCGHRPLQISVLFFAIGSYPPYMKIARQRVSATKSGNGRGKTLQTISIWRWLLFILFFYFSVVLVVIRVKSPEIRGFHRQPARQRDSNRGCNGLSFSEWKLHLFCDLHKTVHRFFRRVA